MFRPSSAAVATSREGHRSPRSGRGRCARGERRAQVLHATATRHPVQSRGGGSGGKGCGFNSTFCAPDNMACLSVAIFLACPCIESKSPLRNATSATVVHPGLRIIRLNRSKSLPSAKLFKVARNSFIRVSMRSSSRFFIISSTSGCEFEIGRGLPTTTNSLDSEVAPVV
jgi:hypothetical protein